MFPLGIKTCSVQASAQTIIPQVLLGNHNATLTVVWNKRKWRNDWIFKI